ncbi:periodic tryptophan protein 1 homolog [Tribolium castaneum]|uniref:Periodic tryptophan protein 1 homolog-like Protein n=1 Tax=Tribolium castaneum TaxID=7070 RepID=D2A2W9_TRICA|nr:PREDICTED: periodic tryptophan protein 1 homolog [Tribolium castaneum]EFA02231.2 Periodic tryptophan protein 1 homolog-like Protein [Tribolium castaneum]|eukprot:XP_008191821.1 PREDICTED: periodic tryptophan protein 1 homolog [Tribolium castaneum]
MEENDTENRVNFITCVKWVKKGVAKSQPEKVQLSKAELVQVIKATKKKLRVTNEENAQGESSAQDEFNLENYDEQDEGTAEALGISSLADLQNNEEENFSESDDSDKEDEVIKPNDNLILVGHVEGDASSLEVYIYNEEEESLYVHHDILLPAFPLCFEWLDYEPNAPKGSYCAIGSMTPIIQVWDLDIINCIEPAFNLGRAASIKKNRPHVGHKDAVLTLAWNKTYEHVLASGSVDKTILLWDLENKTPSTTISAFKDKVQCMQWHKLEAQTLLAGSSDKKAKIFDCRNPETHQTWKINGEVETLVWNPLQPFSFFAGSDTGNLQYFDCRKGQVWAVEAHEKEVTGLVVSPQCPGLLVTSSPDGTIKIWDYTENEATFVFEKDFSLGTVQCLDLSPDLPFVIAAGGDNKSNNFLVHDLRNIDVVKHKFGDRQLEELVAESTEESMNTD